MRILVVEDSERLRRSLSRGLDKAGFSVDAAADGRTGLGFLECYEYDAVVLDLMLPEIPGLELLQRIRERGSEVHVLILSAKDQVEDRVRGLELGADDYLVKPFSFDELCARLQALIRRRYRAKNPKITLGELEIDTSSKRVSKHGVAVHLTPSEYSVLEHLVLRQGRVTSQRQLIERLYDSEAEVSSNVIEVLVSSLRKKIGTQGQPSVLLTRRGFGYVID